ncbi:hypothetical protein Despr_2726 [Desulfobulbus propionicus DSM 2032]|uniref:Uncharacterized protein n=1 Tax=Desulfobulbus propionicus (strain ATCC 33891 / DSM 2032 / VKM B-1956 / 1pr3) TaxID=577650 RepID=A0A7U3YNY6_DESPD|nr:hypothetical protein [Desulfobulbus propionicus]ADW18861.1 hypothetical protein Despr_2726 [Desulfobulbus propionicus DSM 2032]
MPSIIPDNLEDLVAEYKRLWPLMPVLHARAAKLAGKEAIRACGKRLGMFSKQNGKFVIGFEHELEMDVFQDYLLYMYRPRGFSLVRQLLNRKLYPQGSDERMLLEGMIQARFSVFWLREIVPAGGVVALDVITGEELFILDQSLPQQGDAVGLLTAFRLFPFGDAWMHTGANMSFGRIEDAGDLRPLGRFLSEKEERQLNEANIRRWRALLGEAE